MDKSTVYSISDLTKLVEWWFRELFDEFLFWCKAEIGGMKKYWTRWYVDLFEYWKNGKVNAKITGIIWKDSVLQAFLKNTGNTLESIKWKELMIQGYLSFSAQYGLSLSVLWFSKEFEKWKQIENVENIRNTLIEKGTYTKNKEKILPLFPRNFALISSSQSEGLNDFLSVLNDANYPYSYTLFESAIDGDKAIKGVSNAFASIEQSWNQFDCIVLLRWWWWKEAFSWQNTHEVASAVVSSSFPVHLAIWHTTDESLLDEICSKSSKTPTDAGRFFVDLRQELTRDIEKKHLHIESSLESYFAKYRDLQLLYFEWIKKNWIAKITWYREKVDTYFTSILTYSPKALFKKWYALIKMNWKYVTPKKQILLKKGDSIEIESENTTIQATIKSTESFIQK